jgi:voltage-gated potassium channel
MRFSAVLGVAGVNPLEDYKARRVGRVFEVLVLMALLVVFAQVFMYYSGMLEESNWLTHLVWLVFFFELAVNLYNVKNRWLYLRENWLNVVIVCLAFPLIEWGNDWALVIRSLRLVLFIRFFTSFARDFITILDRNRFGQVLIATAFIVLGAGSLFAYLEDRSLWDGIWYALVTITTVGYGDVVPTSESGRSFGLVLMIFGVVFFSLVTANISAFLIGSDQQKLEKDILDYVKQTEKRLAQQQADNEEQVEKIMKHMSSEIEVLRQELKEAKSDSNKAD